MRTGSHLHNADIGSHCGGSLTSRTRPECQRRHFQLLFVPDSLGNFSHNLFISKDEEELKNNLNRLLSRVTEKGNVVCVCACGWVVKNNIGRHASKTVCQSGFPVGQIEVQDKGRESDGEIKGRHLSAEGRRE